jgi:hypothetical protein
MYSRCECDECASGWFWFGFRRVSTRKVVNVEQPATYAQVMNSPSVERAFESYLASLATDGGRAVASVAINFLRSEAVGAQPLGMVCELQLVLEPFLKVGRVKSHPYRAMLMARDGFDIALRLDPKATIAQQHKIAQLEREEERERQKEQQESEKGTAAVASGSSSSGKPALLGLLVVLQLARRVKQARLNLERELLRQLERKQAERVAALEGNTKPERVRPRVCGPLLIVV